MNIPLLYRTVRHLKMVQLYFQVRKRFIKNSYKFSHAPEGKRYGASIPFIPKYPCWLDEKFSFLNLQYPFTSWNEKRYGALWCYNLNYMDWLGQEGITTEEGVYWIDKFIRDIPTIDMGLDPYPIALRSINWIKFFLNHPESVNAEREDCLYSQLLLLDKKLEYHLLGNHLLEDSYALYIGAVYFDDVNMQKRSQKVLYSQLKEQILGDGAHYEQSPMYHCILLDRLLDCINFKRTDYLCGVATQMLGHLETIIWKDKTIPLFNDAAYGIAPTPTQLFDYAQRLGLKWEPLRLKESGFRHLIAGKNEVIVDIGGIASSYQPGHSHADTFSYELRIDSEPVVVDTGISTYNKNERRQYERSTVAHNTVSINNRDSSEVWGGFRVGAQAVVKIKKDTLSEIIATHYGFGEISHTRYFRFDGDSLNIADEVNKSIEAVNYIHLASGIEILKTDGLSVITNKCRIKFENPISIEEEKVYVSSEYNKLKESTLLKIRFNEKMSYTIQL